MNVIIPYFALPKNPSLEDNKLCMDRVDAIKSERLPSEDDDLETKWILTLNQFGVMIWRYDEYNLEKEMRKIVDLYSGKHEDHLISLMGTLFKRHYSSTYENLNIWETMFRDALQSYGSVPSLKDVVPFSLDVLLENMENMQKDIKELREKNKTPTKEHILSLCEAVKIDDLPYSPDPDILKNAPDILTYDKKVQEALRNIEIPEEYIKPFKAVVFSRLWRSVFNIQDKFEKIWRCVIKYLPEDHPMHRKCYLLTQIGNSIVPAVKHKDIINYYVTGVKSVNDPAIDAIVFVRKDRNTVTEYERQTIFANSVFYNNPDLLDVEYCERMCKNQGFVFNRKVHDTGYCLNKKYLLPKEFRDIFSEIAASESLSQWKKKHLKEIIEAL